VGSELLRGRFEERSFLGLLGLTVLVEESDADESEASLILVVWRDLRITSRSTPELMELGVPVVGCSGTMVRRRGLDFRGLEARLRRSKCSTRALDKRLRLPLSMLRSKIAKAAETVVVRCLYITGAERVRLEGFLRSLRLTAVVAPDGSREVVVGFATRGTWRKPEHD
jgi:hypothetical protein